MAEELTDVGRGITLCHEGFGDPGDPPVLLIMGLGTQMVAWHEDFCRELAGRGFYVVRFDNRDVGRSTALDFPAPSIGQLFTRRFRPEQYTLEDMAEDTAGLIEAVDLGPVHVVGASMGAMVGQTLAAMRPELVRSFTSIMSNTGSRLNGQPAFGVMRELLRRAPTEREAFLEHTVRLFKVIGSPESDEAEIRALAEMHYERGTNPNGTGRQLGAILKSGNRAKLLRRIEAPTLVIHGTADRLIRPSGGRATARLIPGAKILRIDGMGHDLPRSKWTQIIDAVVQTARDADREPAGAESAAAAA
jgi:pimeloyl-ACP methyl ester carboxylesterase